MMGGTGVGSGCCARHATARGSDSSWNLTPDPAETGGLTVDLHPPGVVSGTTHCTPAEPPHLLMCQQCGALHTGAKSAMQGGVMLVSRGVRPETYCSSWLSSCIRQRAPALPSAVGTWSASTYFATSASATACMCMGTLSAYTPIANKAADSQNFVTCATCAIKPVAEKRQGHGKQQHAVVAGPRL